MPEILYVGNKGGMEERLVPAAGYDFKTIRISGFQRKLTAKNIRRNIKTVFRLFSSSVESERASSRRLAGYLRRHRRYVSGPVIRAAQKLGIPPSSTSRTPIRHDD